MCQLYEHYPMDMDCDYFFVFRYRMGMENRVKEFTDDSFGVLQNHRR